MFAQLVPATIARPAEAAPAARLAGFWAVLEDGHSSRVKAGENAGETLKHDHVVALYRRNELNQMQLRAINEVAGVLDTAALVDMLRQVKAGADPRSVAETWLAANPLGH